MEIPNEYKKNLYYAILALAVVLVLNFGAKFLSEIKNINSGNVDQDKTIVISGQGEVSAVPDIASISFTIRKESKTVKEAQTQIAETKNKVLEVLKANNVEDKDIKTTNSSFNPKYEYQYREIMCVSAPCIQPAGKSVLVGYETYENITVKIRDVDNAGKLIQELGKAGLNDLSGPNFSIENEDSLKEEARREAIKDARSKALVLAKDLGVRLGKVVSFSENGNYPPQPMMSYAKDTALTSSAPVMELSVGENTIYSNVTVVYEIK
jgi:uncharacterized protein YggE